MQQATSSSIKRSYDRTSFSAVVAQRAHALGTTDTDKAVDIALGLIADNLSEYGTQTFAEALPEGYRVSVARHKEKVEHSTNEMIDLLAQNSGVGSAAADDILFATFQTLYDILPAEEIKRVLAQLPYDVGHVLRSAMPGQKRGSF